jgi:crotonobetaine/carnitine-CoA ligase
MRHKSAWQIPWGDPIGDYDRCIADQRDTVRAFWEWRVDLTPDAPFILSEEGAWTYGEFDRWINRLAQGLVASGIGIGAHVALLLPSGVNLLRLQLALQKAGAVWVPLIPTSTHAEIAHVVNHAEARVLVTDADGWKTIAGGGGRDPAVRIFLTDAALEGTEDLRALEIDDGESPKPSGASGDDPMAIMYTSGSTGRPKGVVQPNIGYRTVAHAVAERMAISAEDRWYCVMPLFHAGATHLVIGPAIAAGASVVLRERFSRSAFWEDVRGNGTTASLLMPAMLSMLLTDPPRPDDRENPLRVLFSHVRHADFVERFDVDVCPGWGMTETMGVGALTPANFPKHPPEMIGLPNPEDAQIRIVSPNGDPLPPGARGELCVKHPHMFKGYFRDPENTALTLRDGWLHSGDLASIDDEGIVYFHGRLKNLIKRAGENISGEELELLIIEHPAVEECVVCGVPDPIWTEEAYATVRVRNGGTVTPGEVAEWCAARLAQWKVPRYVEVVSEPLPTLPNGKTDRRAIASAADPDRAWEKASNAAAAPTDGS